MNEEWRLLVIEDIEFLVSATGRIKRPAGNVLYKNKKGTIVSRPNKETEYVFSLGTSGYLKTTITVNSKKFYINAHSWVAEAFLGPRPKGLVVNHKNGIKTDNRIENLEYCTYSQNIQHAYDNGLNRAKGLEHHNTKLNHHQLEFIKNNIGKMPQRKIAAICGVGENVVSNINTGKTFNENPEREIKITESQLEEAINRTLFPWSLSKAQNENIRCSIKQKLFGNKED